jgi:hypothetical protein
MKQRLAILFLSLAGTIAAAAEAPPPQVEEIRLTVHPAAAAVPAMRYHFMPDLVDQVPGNAALLYLTAAQQMAATRGQPENAPSNADSDKIDRWLAMPPRDLPRKEVEALLRRYSSALVQFRLASLRDHCDFDPPYRTEGYRTLVPYLNDARALARLASLSARLKLATGDFNGAIADLSLPFVQAHHLDNQAFLVQLMVAQAIDQLALDQVQELIAREGSPNLYWALGDLPSPLLDFRSATRMDRAGAYFTIPQLKNARAGKLTAQEWRDALAIMSDVRGDTGGLHAYGTSRPESFMFALLAVKQYPIAKQYLLDRKMPANEVEAMDAAQAIGLYQFSQFDHWTQEVDKGLTLPYWQGIGIIDSAERRAQQATRDDPWSLVAVFGPIIKQTYTTVITAQRRVALWRTVEAVRAYAAAHDGKPPARLQDLTQTPAPRDPMTGKPFAYQVENDHVTIEAPTIELAAPTPTGVRIVLTIAQ